MRRLFSSLFRARSVAGIHDDPQAMAEHETSAKRYGENRRDEASRLLDAANRYADAMPAEEQWWHDRKPFDHRPGNEQYYLQLYAVMNLLRAMELPGGARILEVGSGPGWITEVLMLLGFDVDAVEPSESFVNLSRARIERARTHYRLEMSRAPRFHARTIESADMLPEEAFDGVLFHDSLHHVVDEEAALSRCFRCLRDGGVLGVSEDAWRPGDRPQESALEEEMARYGTLESPFTQTYLDALLARIGFTDIERYHSINGFFPADMGGRSLEQLAQAPATRTNNLTARKSSWSGPTTQDPASLTRARIELLESSYDVSSRRLRLRFKVMNTGETAWHHRPRLAGWVTLAVCAGDVGGADFVEAQPRHRLTRTLRPGESLDLDLAFFLPGDHQERDWRLDLVSEGFFWFSQRGTPVMRVPLS
jgi:SAM-dependent methyltransferase